MIKSPILLFLFISFSFSWAMVILIKYVFSDNILVTALLMFAYMCGPALGALICAWRYDAGRRLQALGLTFPFKTRSAWIWLGIAYLIPVILIIGASLIHALSPAVSLQPPVEGYRALLEQAGQNPALLDSIPAINLLLIAQFFLFAPLINAPLMLSEELGWRGWLWHEWRPYGFWKTTLLTGFVWGLWHVPIVALGHNYPGMPVWGPILFILMCLLITPAYSLVREKTGSVWGACVMHATMNGAAAFGFVIQTQTEMPYRGVVGAGGFIMAALIAFFIILFFRPNKAVTFTA